MRRRSSRPKPRAIEEPVAASATDSELAVAPPASSVPADESTSDRPIRKAKAVALKAAVWTNNARKGPKPKEDTVPGATPPALSTGRKRAASLEPSRRTKAAKNGHSDHDADDAMEGVESQAPASVPAPKRKYRKMVVQSESEAEEEEHPAIPVTASKHRVVDTPKATAKPDHETLFDDEEDAESDGEKKEDSADDVDLDDRDDDLHGLDPDALQQQLTEEQPRWATTEEDDDNKSESRPPSRASFSSGYSSVPASEFIEISSDSDRESDASDSGMQAVYAGLDVAHERVPEPKRHKTPAVPKIPTAQSSSSMQSATGSKNKNATKSHPQSGEQMKPPKLDLAQMQSNPRGRSTVPEKPRGKRELQRDQERPAWDSEIPRAPSRKHSTTVRVKEEPSEAPVPRKIKQEHEAQASSRYSSEIFSQGRRIRMRDQPLDVQRTLQLAIDYYLGFHLTRSTYPELLLKAKFANDALIRSAQDQEFTAILARLTGDKDYRESLATVLSGRVSSFRGSVKITANSILYGKYGVQHDCAALVTRLTSGQAYIYPHKPDKIDPRTQLPIAGKPNTKKPFMHDGVSAVVATFFKGQNSIAEKIEALFIPNEAGNLEATQPMVAIACAAIHSSLEDYSSGGHKQTNFEGSRIQEIYDLHIMILEKLKNQKPAQYHEIMEHIFAEASRGSSFAKGSKAPPTLLQKEALAMLDLSD